MFGRPLQVSIRRACRALPVDRSTYHYRSTRPEQAPLSKRIKEIAETPRALWLSAHPRAASTGRLGQSIQAV